MKKIWGSFSAQTVITMAFKLCQCFTETLRFRLHHPQRLAEVISGVEISKWY